MAEIPDEAEPSGLSIRALDIAVALAIMVFAGIVMFDSQRTGASWGPDGPGSGYFPFYVGMLMFGASAIVLIQALRSQAPRRLAIGWARSRPVLALLIPTAVYVAVIGWIGIYVSSAIYLAYFMRVLGRYSLVPVAALALAVPIATFVLFEIWFLVPLPKGPLEDWLGY